MQCLLLAIRFESSFVVQSRTLYTACGRRTARAYGDRLEFFTIDLADPGFSPTIPCPFANYELAYRMRF